MKRLIGSALAVLICLSSVFLSQKSQSANAEEKSPRKIVTGWIPYYSIDRVIPRVRKLPSAEINIAGAATLCDASQYGAVENAAIENSYLFKNKDLMKEVLPFWFSLKSPTFIRNDYQTGNPGWPMEDTICLIRRAGVQLIPTITDGTSKLILAGYLSKAATRTTVVRTIVELVNKNNFDGIDLDFEGFAFVDGSASWAKTAPNWVAFVKELSIALHAQNKLLSITTPYLFDPAEKQKGYFVYAWAEIASSIDRLRIMTYDFAVAKPGPNGPITWVDKTVKYAISVMASSKVYLGLPGYGRDWITAVSGKCPISAPLGLKAGTKASTFLMVNADRKVLIDKATPIFDEKNSEMTYSYIQSFSGQTASGESTACTVNRTVWFQNERSYAERMALVGKYRLGGAALWTLAMESQVATDEMRKAALAIAPDEVVSTITIEGLTANSIFYGDLFTVKGLLTLKDKTPIAGLTVNLEVKRANGWVKVAELVTATDGTIATPMTLGDVSSLRLTTVGTWERSESISAEQKILVKSKLQIDRPVSISKNLPIVIKARLFPNAVGKSAILQKIVKGKWQTIGSSVTSNDLGEFLFNVIESKRGIVIMRVQVGTEATSESFGIVIR